MNGSIATQATLEAFTRSCIDDYNGNTRHPNHSVFLPAAISSADFVKCFARRSLAATPVVFVRDDSAEMILTPRLPRTLRERALALLGRVSFDVEVRPADGSTLYQGIASARSPRAVVAYEHRAFALA
jgi:hypothetical protein